MKNRLIPFLAMFVGSFCFGLLFILLFMNGTEFNCTRQANETYTCNVRTMFFGKIQISERNRENIVDIIKERDSCSDGCGYRAEFVTSEGRQYPLTQVWTDEGPVMAQINEIRPQMQAGAPTIAYIVDPPWWVLYLIGGLTIMTMLLSGLTLIKGRN